LARQFCQSSSHYASMSDSKKPDRMTSSAREAQLRLIADAVPALIAYYDVKTLRCQFSNRRYAEFNGWTVQTILGKTVQEAIGDVAWGKIGPYVEQAIAGKATTYTREQVLPSGETRMIEVNLLPHFDDDAVLEGAFVLINDITDHWRTEQSLRQSEERMRRFFEATEEGIIFHKDLVITDSNQAMTRITGYSRAEAIGRKTLDFMPERWHQMIIDDAVRGNEALYEVTVFHKDGHEVAVECMSREMPIGGEKMRLIVVRDITARKAAQAHIEFLALHDALTQLPNRAYLMERLDGVLALARRKQRQAAVLFLDLDKFKNVNDSLGHHVGDDLLREVAGRIVATVRDSDVVARLGGDEFIIVLSDISSSDDAAAVAAKLIEAVSEEYQLDRHQVKVSPSIGISVFPTDGATTDELVRHADAAMYHAKESGRANYQFFTPRMFERAFETLDKERQLKAALAQGELVLHYQPQRRQGDNAVVGLEALVRWQHPTRGLVGPDEFISFAEEHGLIASIDRWVLQTACRQLKAWHDEGCLQVPVAVNMSALSFKQRDVVDNIASTLKNLALDAKYLEIELTESLLIDSDSHVLEKLNQLSAMGVGLTIDDFGTGYSSLSYLKRYPINKLKIDRSFIGDDSQPGYDSVSSDAITTAIIQMAHSLKLKTVAEGVETQSQFDSLRSMGCDQFQGYLISHPISAQDVRQFLAC
jgi:diguanylate cyclase (GGDEF)-like protein/PAS domain S-box-containing protein